MTHPALTLIRSAPMIPRGRFCLPTQPSLGKAGQAATRKRRIPNFPLHQWFCEQKRSFGHTSLARFPYPSSSGTQLPLPTVIYSDNHLLAVNKPAGWHSVPNIPKQRTKQSARSTQKSQADPRSRGSKKCLLTHLQTRGLGGGSRRDFLVPLHRIDQPCTGILLFAKTSKAASRVTRVWKGKRATQPSAAAGGPAPPKTTVRGVVKDYLCVVPTAALGAMERASTDAASTDETVGPGFPGSIREPHSPDGAWNQLEGLMLRPSAEGHGSRPRYRQLQRSQQQYYYNDRLRKGRSVRIVRNEHPGERDSGDGFFGYDPDSDRALVRPVSCRWRTIDLPGMAEGCRLVLVRTSEGARHMVRALLAQVGGCPILGDVRYGTGGGPLGDRSVALHAHGLYLDRTRLRLGSLDTFAFRAPVPPTWKAFFGIDRDRLEDRLGRNSRRAERARF